MITGGVGHKCNKDTQYHQQNRIYDGDEIAICLSANGQFNPYYLTGVKMNNLKIRKLTSLECWLLMGFSKEDHSKAKQVNSETQLYKQAGNSIVVNVLMAIFKELLDD